MCILNKIKLINYNNYEIPAGKLYYFLVYYFLERNKNNIIVIIIFDKFGAFDICHSILFQMYRLDSTTKLFLK